jgi:hypothetical protein
VLCAARAGRAGFSVYDTFREFFLSKLELETAQQSDELCYALGWGLYWYMFDPDDPDFDDDYAMADSYVDYYCSCIELQQKSIWTFLWCWNQTVGVKDIGCMIAKMVWDGRADNLVKKFGAKAAKRIKK